MLNNSSDYLDDVTSSMMTTEDYSYDYDSGAEPCNYIKDGQHFFPVLYSLFFVVGFLGNMLVLWVILRGVQMKNVTDVSLLNLAIADLLLVFTLPFLAHQARYTWVFGDAMCKLVLGVYYIGFYAGIYFIVLMSIDRYLAIVHAVFALRIRSKMFGVLASASIWILALTSSFPELLHLGVRLKNNKTLVCNAYPKNGDHNAIRSLAFIKMNILGLLIPLIIVGFCYSMVLQRLQTIRSSKKLAIRLVVVVMVVFFCCWAPYNIAALFKALELMKILNPTCTESTNIQLALQATEAIAYSHSCLNPFLYVFVGEKFRRQLCRLLRQTPCVHVQCVKSYMTQAAGSVQSRTTSVDERMGSMNVGG